MTELKPCHFCGEKTHKGEDYIACNNSGCVLYNIEVPLHYIWNIRNDNPMQERVNRLRNYLISRVKLNHYDDKDTTLAQGRSDEADLILDTFNEIFGEEVK